MKWLAFLALSGCSLYIGDDKPAPGTPGAEPWGAPITGGTMLVTRDDTRAVVADPDRDRIVVLDLTSEQIVNTFTLDPGSQPGRIAEDGAGRLHVALRGGGQLATISGDSIVLSPVCGEPRGVAWEESTDLVHVACATGELVSVPAGGGDAVRVLRLGRDLRDVIVRPTGLTVTTFRRPELIDVDATGTAITRQKLPPLGFIDQVTAQPDVAWRTIALPDGRLLMSHQLRVMKGLSTQPGGYGESSMPCRNKTIESSLTVVGTDGTLMPVMPVVFGALPVDVAVNPAQTQVAVVTAGSRAVKVFAASSINNGDKGDCNEDDSAREVPAVAGVAGSPTSVAWRASGELLVFYPESSSLLIVGRGLVSLGGAPGSDLGRTLFHRQTAVGMACASCHPEGRDDAQVWTFDSIGARRTQNISGGVLARAPFHWNGDMKDLPMLVDTVFVQRMSGGMASDDETRALGYWLDRLPAPRGVVADPDAVLRGEELFSSPELGCRSCHNGDQLTNTALVNVGTGGTMKVPSLIGVGARAPYLHSGCAQTLTDRFTLASCGGGDYHGHTSQLSQAELADLVAYLESL
jgi:DNA-binding beta-propeller fold protein YncE